MIWRSKKSSFAAFCGFRARRFPADARNLFRGGCGAGDLTAAMGSEDREAAEEPLETKCNSSKMSFGIAARHTAEYSTLLAPALMRLGLFLNCCWVLWLALDVVVVLLLISLPRDSGLVE